MIISQPKKKKRPNYLLILKLTGRSTADNHIFKDFLTILTNDDTILCWTSLNIHCKDPKYSDRQVLSKQCSNLELSDFVILSVSFGCITVCCPNFSDFKR